MSKQLITKAEEIRDEVRVGANTAKRVGGMLAEMAREVNGLYDNVLDWIQNEKPQGGGFILTQSDVVDNLADDSQLKPLSAMQGKILKTILDSLVVDNLVTDDETKALSARQGKHLADDISGLSDVYQPLGDYQAAGNYAASEHVHTATEVTEQTNKRFMTDAERGMISSLGTNAAMKDFSNVTTQSLGQNGYCKFPNGLMIQWGKCGGHISYKTYYLPEYFLDTNYSFTTCIDYQILSESAVLTPYVADKAKGLFVAGVTAITNNSGTNLVVSSAWYFTWFAIGRWK